jgi:hypothetical protein
MRVFAEAEHWLVVADIVFSIAWEDDPLTVFFRDWWFVPELVEGKIWNPIFGSKP